jgi:hypothetical protein
MIPFPSKSSNFSPVRIFSRARRHPDVAPSHLAGGGPSMAVLLSRLYKTTLVHHSYNIGFHEHIAWAIGWSNDTSHDVRYVYTKPTCACTLWRGEAPMGACATARALLLTAAL